MRRDRDRWLRRLARRRDVQGVGPDRTHFPLSKKRSGNACIRGVNLADLVQEYGAAVRLLELSTLVAVGSSETAFDVHRTAPISRSVSASPAQLTATNRRDARRDEVWNHRPSTSYRRRFRP